MKSISFPQMLFQNNSQTVSDYEATLSNLKLLLSTEKGEFKYDPFFGIRLKAYRFEQNNSVLRDILIDEIYEQIVYFMPQIKIRRRDITITSDRNKCYITIKGINQSSLKLDTYNLVLFENKE